MILQSLRLIEQMHTTLVGEMLREHFGSDEKAMIEALMRLAEFD